MRTIQMIMLVAIVAFLVPSAQAQVPGTSPAPSAGAEVTSPGVVSGAAELLPEQRAALTKLQQDHWTAMRELWTQIQAKRAALLTARRAGDPAHVQALEKELGELYAARAQERRSFREQVADRTGYAPVWQPCWGWHRGGGCPGMMGYGWGPSS